MAVISIKTGRILDDAVAAPRVLLITKHPFLPTKDGTSAIISLWYDCLRDLGLTVEVLSFDYVASRWSDAGRARLARDGVRLHVVNAYGERHAGLRRLVAVAHAAIAGHRFAPESLRTDPTARATLDALFATGFDLIVVHGVDAVYLAGAQRLSRHAAPTLLDIHDHVPFRILALQRALVRILRWRGIAASRHVSRSDVLAAVSWPIERYLTRVEARVASVCDRVLCSSPGELAVLRAGGIGSERLVPISWPVTFPAGWRGSTAAAASTPHHQFGFIGSGALFNIEALLFFLREIWPLIRSVRPNATLLVAGRAGSAIARLPRRRRPGITIAGWVEDVGDFYRNVDVVVIPLLSGTGVSVKTMEAAAYAKPIVSTEAGLRGLQLRDGIEVRRADTAAAFAAAAIGLLEDQALAARLAQAAGAAIAHAHDPQAFRRSIIGVVEPLLGPLTLKSGRTG